MAVLLLLLSPTMAKNNNVEYKDRATGYWWECR